MRTGLAAAVIALVVVSGCSSGDSSGPTESGSGSAPTEGAAEFPENTYEEADVVDHLDLTVVDDGLYYEYAAGDVTCELAVVMADPNMVSTYADAGDVVATNPDRTVGVKITDGTPGREACYESITQALADFPR